jgi:hypothetical protein
MWIEMVSLMMMDFKKLQLVDPNTLQVHEIREMFFLIDTKLQTICNEARAKDYRDFEWSEYSHHSDDFYRPDQPMYTKKMDQLQRFLTDVTNKLRNAFDPHAIPTGIPSIDELCCEGKDHDPIEIARLYDAHLDKLVTSVRRHMDKALEILSDPQVRDDIERCERHLSICECLDDAVKQTAIRAHQEALQQASGL